MCQVKRKFFKYFPRISHIYAEFISADPEKPGQVLRNQRETKLHYIPDKTLVSFIPNPSKKIQHDNFGVAKIPMSRNNSGNRDGPTVKYKYTSARNLRLIWGNIYYFSIESFVRKRTQSSILTANFHHQNSYFLSYTFKSTTND